MIVIDDRQAADATRHGRRLHRPALEMRPALLHDRTPATAPPCHC